MSSHQEERSSLYRMEFGVGRETAIPKTKGRTDLDDVIDI